MPLPSTLALRFRGDRISPDSCIYFGASSSIRVGDEIRVPEEGIVLGRSMNAAVRIASNGVARQHVRIAWNEDGELTAEDLGSTNGTEVNGVAGRLHRLRAGDILTLAGCFDFEVVEAP